METNDRYIWWPSANHPSVGPHHLQTTHPLPKTKQGRYSFFPQGWNLFRPKLSTKFCLAAQPISDSLSPVGLQYHPPLSTISKRNLSIPPPSSLLPVRQFCSDSPWSILGGYLPASMLGTKVVIFEIYRIDHSAQI